ncbi:MAG: cyclic nucleotide-binding domain-containing protein [Spirochaetia bacterium]
MKPLPIVKKYRRNRVEVLMPKAVTYKANSIVYFQGDVNEKIYILKSGKVSLNAHDIETGQEIQDVIGTGEFFGVKSALGRYPREETAVVLADSNMLIFTVPEFEQFVLQNTRIIVKMLKVFSNQLRRIHKQVRNLLDSGNAMDPEEGLFRIGSYYLEAKKYHQALYAFRRYITYYPSGKFSEEATANISKSEQLLQKYGKDSASAAPSGDSGDQGASKNESRVRAPESKPAEELTGVAKKYYNAVSLFSQEKYQEALQDFKDIMQGEGEYTVKSVYEYGRCLFGLEKYKECIEHYTQMIKNYPKHPELRTALIYVGNCHENLENTQKASDFYKKVISMSSENEVVHRKAKKALRRLEEK